MARFHRPVGDPRFTHVTKKNFATLKVMAPGEELIGFDARIEAGLSAFGTDPSYAIAIARQAGSLVAQQVRNAGPILVGLTAEVPAFDV